MVFTVGETVMLFPVPADVPPHELVNHSATAPVPALPPTIDRVVLPLLQMVVIPEILRGAVDNRFKVTLIPTVLLHIPTGSVIEK